MDDYLFSQIFQERSLIKPIFKFYLPEYRLVPQPVPPSLRIISPLGPFQMILPHVCRKVECVHQNPPFR